MNDLEKLAEIDWWYVFIAVVLLLIGIKLIWSLADWFLFDKLKIETKKMREKRIDHELLMKTVQDLAELHTTHEEDTKQSIRHDEMIRNDLHSLTTTVTEIVNRLDNMQKKNDATEMAKLKEKLLAYYRKYKNIGEWESFESDVFWGLYDSYISHGGNSFVKHDIEPVMRNLKIKD